MNLTSVPNEWEANVIVSRLQSEGIAASATGGFTAGFRAEAPGLVTVVVDSRDREQAVEVMQTIEQERRERVESEGESGDTNHTAGRTSGFEILTWLSILGLLGGVWQLGAQRALWVIALALLIIGPAAWLKHKFALR
ncbi:MAG: hypothetical protein ACO1RT_15820 [Planctomycetaceae bacterium]